MLHKGLLSPVKNCFFHFFFYVCFTEECLHECGENSYCFNGRCYCSPGYVHDPVTRECFDPEGKREHRAPQPTHAEHDIIMCRVYSRMRHLGISNEWGGKKILKDSCKLNVTSQLKNLKTLLADRFFIL